MVPLCGQCGDDQPDNTIKRHLLNKHGLNTNPPAKRRVVTFLSRMGADAFIALYPGYWIEETDDGFEIWKEVVQ